MRVIDAHVHLYPPVVNRDPAGWAAAQSEAHWAALCTRRRSDGRPVQGFPDVTQLLRDMDAAGSEKAVLLGWYWEKPETCVWQNQFYAECVRAHPDRLAAFATVHPAAGRTALDEVRRAASEGLIGLGELSPHSQHFAIDDPVWREVLALAGELKLPVNLHVNDPQGKKYPGRVETPREDFRKMAREFPQTTFILAHWGGGLPFLETNPMVRKELANVYYDTAASPLLYDERIWRAVLDVAPVEKVLFGSDYPLVLYPKAESQPGVGKLVAEAAASDLTPAEQSAVLGENAARLLKTL